MSHGEGGPGQSTGHHRKFPARAYDSIGAFLDDYVKQSQTAMKSLDLGQLARAADCLTEAIVDRRTIYACGNGGSAATANHLMCDFLKGIQTDTPLLPRVMSLPANLELSLAIANDIAFQDIFVYPLRTMAEKDDVLLAISASGDSENVVRALRWAKDNGLRTIAMTAFEGGRCRTLADISLHVDAGNYGVAEDCHHALAHLLAQYVRLRHMDPQSISTVKF
jgi:D-sedoheptulose 7-phosphate isomerase